MPSLLTQYSMLLVILETWVIFQTMLIIYYIVYHVAMKHFLRLFAFYQWIKYLGIGHLRAFIVHSLLVMQRPAVHIVQESTKRIYSMQWPVWSYQFCEQHELNKQAKKHKQTNKQTNKHTYKQQKEWYWNKMLLFCSERSPGRHLFEVEKQDFHHSWSRPEWWHYRYPHCH